MKDVSRLSQSLRVGGLRPVPRRADEQAMSSSRPPTASPHRAAELSGRAASMRSSPTSSEQLLWLALRGGRLGVAFRRQVVLGPFVVDFLAPTIRLVVEMDGGYHSRRQALDARRDEKLQRWGYRVLRVQAEEVVHSLPDVVQRIREAIQAGG